MLKNYFLVALRNIVRNKSISLINIIGLSVSMSVCLLLILIVADQYSYDKFHSKKDKIYRVITDRLQLNEYLWSTATTTYMVKEELKNHTAVEYVTNINRRLSGIAQWNDAEIPYNGYFTDNQFLQLFDFKLLSGNRNTALAEPNSVILKKELADKLFGTADPMNQVITLEDRGDFVVTGIMDKPAGKSHFEFDMLASFGFLEAKHVQDTSYYTGIDDWDNIYDNYVYIEVKEGASLASIKSSLAKFSRDHHDPEADYEYTFILQPLTGITPGPLLSNMTGFGLPMFMIYIMLGIALIVLSSACFNYANLTTARAINRAKEIGVRKVIGAMRSHIFGQFMMEAAIMAVLAFFFADLMVQFIVPRMNNFFLELGAPMQFEETSSLVWWFLGFVILAGLISGLIPALFFSATKPIEALKRTVQLNQVSKKLWFARFDIRKVLVVMQFAFSIFFVITMLAVYQQLNFVLTKDHGFTTEGVINVKLQGYDYEKLKSSVEQLSYVEHVSGVSHLPALGTNNTMILKKQENDPEIISSYFAVGQQYLETLELELIAGRSFPDVMPQEEQFMLINETAADALGWSPADAVGQQVLVNDINLQIIGVVKDFHYERLDEQIGPMALRHQPEYFNSLIAKVAKGNEKRAIADIEAVWAAHTNRPYDYSYYADDLRLSYGHFEALLMITGYVTIIVVSLACLGLLGMVIYHVQNRTKEIGVRKTLGASSGSILTTIGKSFFILLGIAYLIGGPLSYFVNNAWLQMNVYRIDFGILDILLGFMAVFAVVALTIGYQMFKAMRVNPTESLRHE